MAADGLIEDPDKKHNQHLNLSVFSFQAHFKERCCIITKHEKILLIVSVKHLKGVVWQSGEVLLPIVLN